MFANRSSKVDMQSRSNLDIHPTSAEVLQWSVGTERGAKLVSLVGEVDLATAGTLARVLDELIGDRPSELIVDLARVSFLDSTGIHCLLSASRNATGAGCTLVVRNPSPSIERIFTICGVDQLLLAPADASERSHAAPTGS